MSQKSDMRCWGCGKLALDGVCRGEHQGFSLDRAFTNGNISGKRTYNRNTYAKRYAERAKEERAVMRETMRGLVKELREERARNIELAARNAELERVLSRLVNRARAARVEVAL